MSEFRSEVLQTHHRRGEFSCGVKSLDDYLQRQATQDARRYAAATFVFVPENQPSIIAGFYTLSAFSIRLEALSEELRKILPRYPEVPSLLIGRLARDEKFPGLGSRLLSDALSRCQSQAEEI